jgi:formate hydrogenlyase subunit 6/NADH:ubiquinone oxidoreductase subunit I
MVTEEFPQKDKRPTTSRGIVFEAKVTSYRIDYNQCINCGICVDICPTQALSYDKKFVFPRTRSSLLALDQVHRPRTIRVEQGLEE